MVMRGISGRQRVARHLWRMCFALFVASVSIFSARAHLLPVLLRKTGVLSVLSFLPLGLLVFWIFRLRFAKRAIALYPARTERPARAFALNEDSRHSLERSFHTETSRTVRPELERVG